MTDTSALILAGDIGGTNARFGCLQKKPEGGWKVHHFVKVKGADYPTFEAALENYLGNIGIKPRRAAFCAAGPVEDGYINLTNTDWQISTSRLKEMHGFEQCELYNDFSGMTRSIPELADDEFTIIRSGQPHKAEPILVAGPGTGFGVGYLVPTKAGWHVIASEGGHVTYSPQSSLELELLQVLKRDRDFVSLELVSSGKGLPVVHKAVCEIHGVPYEHTAPDLIRERAIAGDAVSRDVCNIRASATMGAIGDLALTGGARGGIVLAGGVSERMIDFYMQPSAMNRYLHRGPQSEYVRGIPIRLLKCPHAPLIGSAASLDSKLMTLMSVKDYGCA